MEDSNDKVKGEESEMAEIREGTKRTAEKDLQEPQEKKSRTMDSEAPDPGDREMIEMLGRISVDLAEFYSPPRTTAQGEKMGLKVGEAMDLTTGWDFRRPDHRERAREYRRKHRPKLLVGSPMCTMFCLLQNLSQWTEEKQRRWTEAVAHMEFTMEMYLEQIKDGNWFLHEHPASASSWTLEKVREVMNKAGVEVTIADQCMYGLMTWGKSGKCGKGKEEDEIHDQLPRDQGGAGGEVRWRT